MKNGLVVSAVALLLFCGTVECFATDKRVVLIGANAAYLISNDDRVDNTPMYGITAEYFYSELFSLAFDMNYAQSDIDTPRIEAEQTSLLITARYHFKAGTPKATPYVGVGLGYYWTDAEMSSPGISIDIDNSVGFHINGGLDFLITDNVVLDTDLKYIWNSTDAEATNGFVTESGNLTLDAFAIGVGVKYMF